MLVGPYTTLKRKIIHTIISVSLLADLTFSVDHRFYQNQEKKSEYLLQFAVSGCCILYNLILIIITDIILILTNVYLSKDQVELFPIDLKKTYLLMFSAALGNCVIG